MADRPAQDLIDRTDAVSYIEAMTWSRVFPAEPAPSTRDLVVFTAALGAAKRRLALIDAAPPARQAKDEPCARYFGSNGLLCATHNRRFVDAFVSRCAARLSATGPDTDQ